ncbi:hypothetical protein NADFUDRAFT_51396 [Nadsonia fulvescens var. elongata DSM 6958]|uniref:Amine oxidase n=1 Tax=Nadsonia fulvescens var. elongata DSM 6958 TaxID=857566 RepID=A0A1E3PL18_9ASCO|nr:hypothetical protein NADFUDRAFT_51396 [Nadsonia fulvescens var. elongata DSM 6958]
MAPHPLDCLSVEEIKTVVSLVKKHHGSKTLHFKTVNNVEPPKALLVPYLEAVRAGKTPITPPRVGYANYYVLNDKRASEAWIDLNNGTITNVAEAKPGTHPPIDHLEAEGALKVIFADPQFKAAIKKCGLEDKMHTVACDGWMYACQDDAVFPRYLQGLMYARDPETNHPESNIYAYPIPFVPVYDVLNKQFVRIDWCATGGDEDDVDGFNYDTRKEEFDCLEHCVANEYHPSLQKSFRTDLKPYNVVQPEGPSFTCEGNTVSWQKWKFIVGFTTREGMVIHDVTYDGRNVFHRLSMSEMAVPYADPRPPLHRKMAFDFGDCGGGNCANELSLGCDCLGTIKYFDGNIVDPNGKPIAKKNVICMHEQDDGILWKHTNYRTGAPAIVRRRILVLQTILTVANYEYIFAWHFSLDGSIDHEIRATGIVSTQAIDAGKTSKWGVVVSPGALAASHQHIFCLRIDPAIDGYNNTAMVAETKTYPTDPETNPNGNAFSLEYTPFETSGFTDWDVTKNRYINIVNENKINPISGRKVGYKLGHLTTPLLLASEGSHHRSRAAFATHGLWVTKHRDQEFYAGGVWTNQSFNEVDGVRDAAARNENVRDDDIVVWHSFGLTHYPRVEDFPVMPSEIMKVHLSPVDFFTANPAIDVPPSTQKFNRSVEVLESKCCNKL